MKKIFRIDYCLLVAILSIGAFLRLYKLDQLLGFWYDQGRDALVVWRLLHEGKFFLIGPVTGIEGIFLGPFYYYLMTPFYFISGGSPAFVASVLNLISVFGLYLLYLVTKEFFGRKIALLATFLVAISYNMVVFSRWLSHPPLLPTFSLLIVYALLKIYRGHKSWWIVIGLAEGLCLQLEAASAVFFLPTILVFTVWQRKKIADLATMAVALFVFALTLAPQIYFNIRHQGILQGAFHNFIVGERSFRPPFLELFKQRLATYFDVFFSQLFYDQKTVSLIFLGILSIIIILKRKEIFGGERKILWLWLLVPLVSYMFYQGNYGYFWGYYLSGFWLIFVVLVAFLLSTVWRSILGKIIFLLFLVVFLYINVPRFPIYYKTGVGIIIRDQLLALDWIYQNAGDKNFNVDVYVPPVIPYAYDYLFKWYGIGKYGREPLAENIPLLYTLYEVDSPHPERLTHWLERQSKIGKIVEEKTFGDITVQKRERIK